MKIILNTALLTASVLCFSLSMPAQPAKWFFTFSVGYELAGPAGSIKKSQTENGYNIPATFSILSSAPRSFPYVSHGLSLLGMIGTQVSKRGSAYIMVGKPGAAEVRGYDGRFNNNIKYQVFQFSGGYQLSFSNSRSKIGAGPSLFILQTGKNNHDRVDTKITDKHSAIKPGLSFMGRVPFGKGKKLVGLELFGELNIASTARFEDFSSNYNRPEPYNAAITGGIIGLSLALQKKTTTEL